MFIQILQPRLAVVIERPNRLFVTHSQPFGRSCVLRLHACSEKTPGSSDNSLRRRSRRKGSIIEECEDSLLTVKNLQNFISLSLREILLVELHSKVPLGLERGPTYLLLVILDLALGSLLLDFVLDIIDALPQNFLQEVFLLDLFRAQRLNLPQLLLLGFQDFF